MQLLPKTKTQNILAWVGVFFISLFLVFLKSLAEQLPGDDPILWRPILSDVVNASIAIITPIVAGLVFPRFGGEERAQLANKLGTKKATRALKVAVTNENVK